MARAKQTGRAEARRRYRQSTAPLDGDADGELLDDGEEATAAGAARTAPPRTAPARAAAGGQAPSGRPGFLDSFRLAYHRPDIREDLVTLPMTVRSRGFLAGLAMVVAGGVIWYVYPAYSGSLQIWQLLVVPGSALAPQLVAGFFAPRASYLLGFLIGLLQPIVYLVVENSPHVQEALTARGFTVTGGVADQVAGAFFTSVVQGALFAAMAAWYRRFLSISSQRTAAVRASRASGRTASKPQTRRTASR